MLISDRVCTKNNYTPFIGWTAVVKSLPRVYVTIEFCDKGPPQVKCQLLISSIFDAMNFQHFLVGLRPTSSQMSTFNFYAMNF